MRESPWENLPPGKPGDLTVLRVAPDLPFDFYWARNAEGSLAFVLSLSRDPGELGAFPKLKGISVLWAANMRQLQLILANRLDWELFASLCQDLIETTRSCNSELDAMNGILSRLNRWQRLLSRGTSRILEEREIRGLMGELLFLRDELLPRFGKTSVVSWQGPDELPQDFAIGKTLFEVKTHLAGSPPRVIISSPEQLWRGNNVLYLVVVPLARVDSGGISLPDLVDEISRLLVGTAGLELFETRLSVVGYLDLQEYREHRYVNSAFEYFEVVDGFPMIPSSSIMRGVEDVRFSLRFDMCDSFKVTPRWDEIKENRQ